MRYLYKIGETYRLIVCSVNMMHGFCAVKVVNDFHDDAVQDYLRDNDYTEAFATSHNLIPAKSTAEEFKTQEEAALGFVQFVIKQFRCTKFMLCDTYNTGKMYNAVMRYLPESFRALAPGHYQLGKHSAMGARDEDERFRVACFVTRSEPYKNRNSLNMVQELTITVEGNE